MTVKTSISLTDQQDAFVRRMVEEGRYSSFSAVIQQGLEKFKDEILAEELEQKALATLLNRRLEGPFISAEEFSQRIDSMLERKRRERGL